MSVTALILAAGRSRRMGSPKAFLELNGEPLLGRILRTAFAGGVGRAIIVVGSSSDPALVCTPKVERLLAERSPKLAAHVRIVVGEPDKTPIDSIRAGLGALEPGHALLLWPVDHPFADPELVRSLITELGDAPQRIALPWAAGQGGHPVLFSADVVRELSSPAADRGANAVVNANRRRLLTVPTRDPRCLAPLNTPEEAEALGVRVPEVR